MFVSGTVLLTVAVPGWLAWSVGLDRYRRAACQVVGADLPGGPRAGTLVTEGVGELAAEPAVFLGELAVALTGFGEPAKQGGVGRALQANQQISRLRPVLEPTEPAELRAVGVELVKANEADFIGVGSLQVTAEAGTGKTAQDGVAGVEALDREQVPGTAQALHVL